MKNFIATIFFIFSLLLNSQSTYGLDNNVQEFGELANLMILDCSRQGENFYHINSNMRFNDNSNNGLAGEAVNQKVLDCMKESLELNTQKMSKAGVDFVVKVIQNPITSTFFYDISFCGFVSAYAELKLRKQYTLNKNQSEDIVRRCASRIFTEYRDKLNR